MALSSNLYSSITPANADSILSSTAMNYRAQLKDNFFKDRPLFFWLRDKAKVRLDGGERIAEPLLYENNSTAQFYSGYETLSTTPQEGLTLAFFEWVEANVAISMSDKEKKQNAGSSAFLSLTKAKMQQAQKSLSLLMNQAAYATSQVDKKIQSIDVLVDSAGTVGGINRSTYSWFQAQEVASGSFAAQGLADLRTIYNNIVINSGKRPDFGVTTQTVLESYEATMQPQMRFADQKMADAGFINLAYKNTPLTMDPDCNSQTLYFLNSEAINFVTHSGTDFETTPVITPHNQAAGVFHIRWMGNVTTSEPRACGKLTGVTA